MSRKSRALFAGAIVSVMMASCSPYPIYNSSGVPPREEQVDSEADDSNPVDHEPAVESRRVRRDLSERAPVSSATTIDARLFRRIVDTYIGTPYKRGGANLRGIDCSNLVASLYRDYDGTKIPESTRGLYRLPDAVEDNDLQVGDVVFFNFAETRSPSHVGVYLGDGHFVHASETAGVVIASLDDAVYRSAYRGARRVAPQLHTGE